MPAFAGMTNFSLRLKAGGFQPSRETLIVLFPSYLLMRQDVQVIQFAQMLNVRVEHANRLAPRQCIVYTSVHETRDRS